MSPAAGTARTRRTRRKDGDSALGPVSGIVAIVGRPNVGKSTLFNRLTGQRQAIVDETAGLTRDRLYGVAEWRGRRFTLVDTAGLDPALVPEDPGIAELTRGTQQQARVAIEEADLCILMVDVRTGVTGLDEDVARILRSGGKPVILAGNKADSAGDPYYAHELYRLGLGEPRLISALSGTDTGDLLDEVLDRLPPSEGAAEDRVDELRVAIIGRPNVGKSSLLNYLVGEERALVSSVAGTTRDTVDTVVDHHGRQVRLVDTAGIRRRGRDQHRHRALQPAPGDARPGAERRRPGGGGQLGGDRRPGPAHRRLRRRGRQGRGDHRQQVGPGAPGGPGRPRDPHQDRRRLRLRARGPGDDPERPPGAQRRQGAGHRRDRGRRRATRIPTPALNQLIREAIASRPPAMHKGRRLKILYATQASSPNPTVVLFVNDPDLLHFSYERYLENQIRAVFGFAGVRLHMVVRRRNEPEA